MNRHYAKFFYFVVLISISSFSEIYKYTDSQGKLHFSDKPIDQAQVVSLKSLNNFSGLEGSFLKRPIQQNKVVIFSADWCGVCKDAVSYFRSNKIPFEEFDIDHNLAAKGYFQSLGAPGVPVLLFHSKTMTGWSVNGFKSLYQ